MTYANSVDPDQPVHSRNIIRIYSIRLHQIYKVDYFMDSL